MLSTKNAQLSMAGQDLGLGDALKTQVENEINMRKKKLLQNANTTMTNAQLGPATQSLFAGGGANGS